MRGIILHGILAILFAILAMRMYRDAFDALFGNKPWLSGIAIISALCAVMFSGVTVYCVYIVYREVLRLV